MKEPKELKKVAPHSIALPGIGGACMMVVAVIGQVGQTLNSMAATRQ